MYPTTFARYIRVVLITALLWSTGSQATPLNIPNYPLFLTSTGVTPNLMMTIDNSGSMQRSWVPEDIDGYKTTKRFASPSFNGMYYNPKFTYQIPARSDKPANYYNTSFTSAWFNGFDTSLGSVNLSTSYKRVDATSPSTSSSSARFIDTTGAAAYYYLFYKDNFSTQSTPPNNCTADDRSDDDCYIKYVVGDTSDIFNGDANAKKQNFANWYSFYRTRAMTVMSAAMISVDGVKDNSIRFGWQTINGGCNIDPGSACGGYGTTTVTTTQKATCQVTFTKTTTGRRRPVTTYTITINTATDSCSTLFTDIPDGQDVKVSGVSNPDYNKDYTVTSSSVGNIIIVNDPFPDSLGPVNDVTLSWIKTTTSTVSSVNRLETLNSTKKTGFYNWLERIVVSGYTPMRSALKRVGEYCTTSGVNSPYAENPYVSAGTERACRKNYHVLFTDGLWNTDSGYTAPVANPDQSGGITLGNSGDTGLPAGTPTSYSPRAPYKDVNVTPGGGTYTNQNSLADTAFYYWATDLRSGLANKVSSNVSDFSGTVVDQFWNPKNDPATWQHLVNYGIGLGLSQTLVSNCYYNSATKDPNNPTPGCPAWAGSVYAGDFAGLLNGAKNPLNWPRINQNPTAGDEPDGHVYDLWHMAINSRGKFYSADSPQDVVTAFKDVLDTVSSTADSGGGSAVSSNVARTTEAGATAFVALFNADWSGTLQAFAMDISGTLGTSPYWQAQLLILPGNPPASAPPYYNRKIFTWNNSAAQEFAYCTNDVQTALNKDANGNTDSLCSQRLAWLRGYTAITGASWSSTNQNVKFTAPNHGLATGNAIAVTGVTPTTYNGTYDSITKVDKDSFTVPMTSDPGAYVADEIDNDPNNDDRVRYRDFRDRTSSVLGDIMNSNTVYSYKEDFGYGGATIAVSGSSAYKQYVTGKSSRIPVIFVGANDGMLHAFDAEISGANMGKELFAYVPAAVYGNLSALTNPGYLKNHKYFVDATPTVGDAYNGTAWKTYVVGGLGAGGKSIYALDVTSVSSTNFFTASPAAGDIIKWEFTDTDLGLTFSQPKIAAVSTAGTTQWAAIFSNGYNSTNEKACLYVVNLFDVTKSTKICTKNSDSSNGLSTPYPFDKNGDGIVDVVYAGDLQGNLWKFENSSGTWSLGNGGNPLFTATNASSQAQAITTQPKALVLPDNSVMVYFGTGRYLEASDLTDNKVQTFYGIKDSNQSDTVPRTSLKQQTIISSTDTKGAYTIRTVTNDTMTADQRGCYVDLPKPTATGEPAERVSSSPLIQSFTTGFATRVIFTTSTPQWQDPCDKGGTSWLMELNTSCGRLNDKIGGNYKSPIDLDQSGQIDSSDLVTINGVANQSVSGVKLKTETGIVTQITWVEGEGSKGLAYKILPGSRGKVEVVTDSSDTITGGVPKRVSWEQIQ